MDFQLPVTSDSFRSRVIGFPVPENMSVAVAIFLLSLLQAEIWAVPVWRPPSWISDFLLHRMAFEIAPSCSLTPKTWG